MEKYQMVSKAIACVACTVLTLVSIVNAANAQTKLTSEFEYNLFSQNLFADPTQAPVVNGIALNGTDFYVGGDDRCVYKFDFTTARASRVFQPSDSWVRAVACSPVANEIATISQNGELRIWNPKTQQEIRRATEKVRGSHAFAYSPNGKVIAVASYDQIVEIFNVADLAKLRTWTAPGLSCTAIQFSHTGEMLAVGGRNGVVYVWDTKTGSVVKTFNFGKAVNRRVRALAFSPSDTLIAVGGENDEIDVWDLKTNQKVVQLTLPEADVAHPNAKQASQPALGKGKVFSLTFCNNDGLLVSGDSLNRVILWNVSNAQMLSNGNTDHHGTVTTLQYVEKDANHPEGPYVLSGSFDTTVKRWKFE